jgi:hypothetical protein
MKTMQQKIEELENQITVHKKQYHRNGCCYGGTNGCCDAEELISNKLRLLEILRYPDGTPNVSPGILDNGTPGIKLPLGRYHYPKESDKDFLHRMKIK